MITKEYSSASKANEVDPTARFEPILLAGNKCLTNVSNRLFKLQQVIEETVKKFFASHDHLIKEVKDQFVRFTGVMVVELETTRKKDEERDQKIQAIYEMAEKTSDLIHARLGYEMPSEGDYLEAIVD